MMNSTMNGSSNGSSERSGARTRSGVTTRGKKRKIRRHGEAARVVSEILAKNPEATVAEIAKATGMTPVYASKISSKVKREGFIDHDLIISPKSKLAHLFPPELKEELSTKEKSFLVTITFIGMDRAEQLMREARERIMSMIGAT